MKQIKKLYKVTKHETHDYGDGNIQEHTKDFTTWAVSEKKAISNIMFRLGINKWDLHCGGEGDGGASICLRATAIQK